MKKKIEEAQTMGELMSRMGPTIKSFSRSDRVEGKIVSIKRSEILLDVGSKSEGLIDPAEVEENPELYRDLKVGDTVQASVIYPENEQGYVILSLSHAASESKWAEFEAALKSGATLEVKVAEYNKGGLLVDAGISGFIPLSHLDRSRFEKGEKAEDLIGKVLKVKVIEINRYANRLVFSEKEALSLLTSDLKTEILSALKAGGAYSGTVVAVLPFGLFVEIRDREERAIGVEGLVHISEIAWEKIDKPSDLYKVGDKIQVKILDVDPRANKLALSVKALSPNPWDKVAEKYKVGETVRGKVSKIAPFGAFVILEPGLEGLIHVSETIGPLKVGEEVEASIISVEPSRQKLGLSVRKIKDLKVTYR